MTLYARFLEVIEYSLNKTTANAIISIVNVASSKGTKFEFKNAKIDKKKIFKCPVEDKKAIIKLIVACDSQRLASIKLPVDLFPSNKRCKGEIELINHHMDTSPIFYIEFHYCKNGDDPFDCKKCSFDDEYFNEIFQEQQEQKNLGLESVRPAPVSPQGKTKRPAPIKVHEKNEKNKNNEEEKEDSDYSDYDNEEVAEKKEKKPARMARAIPQSATTPKATFSKANSPAAHQQHMNMSAPSTPQPGQQPRKIALDIECPINQFRQPPFRMLMTYQPPPFIQPNLFQDCIQRPDNMPKAFGNYL